MQLKEEKLMSNFIEHCLNGDALLSDVDNYIDEWHESDSEISLHEFLGMSRKEYSLFLENEEYLAYIIIAHREKKDINDVVLNDISLAARADSQEKANKLEVWLRSNDLWD